jgi:hypothetical protein
MKEILLDIQENLRHYYHIPAIKDYFTHDQGLKLEYYDFKPSVQILHELTDLPDIVFNQSRLDS